MFIYQVIQESAEIIYINSLLYYPIVGCVLMEAILIYCSDALISQIKILQKKITGTDGLLAGH